MIGRTDLPDLIVVMRAEVLALQVRYEDMVLSEEEADAVFDRKCVVEAAARLTPATTVHGAIVSLEWAISENERNRRDGLSTSDLVGSLMQGTLGVLRTLDPSATTH